ncbi:MAG: DUF3106 domain-containing protein [Silvibacterium sp.]
MRIGNNSSGPGGRLMRSALRVGLFAALTAGLLFGSPLGWASPRVGGHFSGRGGGFARFQNHTPDERQPQGSNAGGRMRPALRQGPGNRQGAGPGMRQGLRPGQQHLPAWWQAHRGLSPQQKADAMRREPGFRNLPPGQQQRLLNRLQNFDQRPPQVQARMMDRNEMFERLSPERQQEVRGAAQALSHMSLNRQALIRHSFQQLRGMPPEEREQMLHSAYGGQFTPQERTVLGNMLSIEPYQPHIIQPYFGR